MAGEVTILLLSLHASELAERGRDERGIFEIKEIFSETILFELLVAFPHFIDAEVCLRKFELDILFVLSINFRISESNDLLVIPVSVFKIFESFHEKESLSRKC